MAHNNKKKRWSPINSRNDNNNFAKNKPKSTFSSAEPRSSLKANWLTLARIWHVLKAHSATWRSFQVSSASNWSEIVILQSLNYRTTAKDASLRGCYPYENCDNSKKAGSAGCRTCKRDFCNAEPERFYLIGKWASCTWHISQCNWSFTWQEERKRWKCFFCANKKLLVKSNTLSFSFFLHLKLCTLND